MPPYSPNFVFTDQVPASQLIGLAQIAQAEDAARKQMMSSMLQSINQRGASRENAAAERYRYQSQADLQRQQLAQQAAEAERNRAARSSELDRSIAANKDIATIDANARTGANTRTRQDAAENEEYNFVLSQVESENPPTDDEFAALSVRLAPDRAKRLDSVRKQTIDALHKAADNADAFANFWNTRLDNVGKNPGQTLDTIVAEATKSQAGKFIIFDPQIGKFRSVVSRPRQPKLMVPAAPPPVTINDLLKGGASGPKFSPAEVQAFGASAGGALSDLVPAILPFLRPAAPPVIHNPEAPYIPPGWPQPGYPLQ